MTAHDITITSQTHHADKGIVEISGEWSDQYGTVEWEIEFDLTTGTTSFGQSVEDIDIEDEVKESIDFSAIEESI